MRAIGVMVAALAAMTSVPALAATDLACIGTGYSDKGQAAIDAFLKNFKGMDDPESGASGDFVPAIAARAGECAARYGWSMDAVSDAIFYQSAALLEQGLLRHPPLSVADLGKIEAALARADKARLRRIFGPVVEAEAAGATSPELSNDDSVYVGMMLLSSGVPLDDKTGEFAGALIGARIMQEIYAEKFTAR